MGLITDNIKWIMLVTGVITCSMLLATVNPQAGLMNTFGASIDGPIAEIVVRNWGALIGLVGGMLIYAAFKPELRAFVLVIACISKLTFISLVLTFGSQFMGKAIVAVVFDSIVVALYLVYLFAAKSE